MKTCFHESAAALALACFSSIAAAQSPAAAPVPSSGVAVASPTYVTLPLATTSRLLYTWFFDNSMLPDGPAREKDLASRTALFTRALQNMKTLAEGGKLPPPPPRVPPGR